MFFSQQNRSWFLGLAAGLTMAMCVPVSAQAAGKGDDRPQASLSAQATKEVSQDTVTITLAKEVRESSQAEVVKALSNTLDSAMKDAKAESRVQARSGNYQVWPHTDEDGDITNWAGRAEIVLKSGDFEAASQLASKLSDRMPISGMGFSVSPELRAKEEQGLVAEAAKAFQNRAQVLAAAFGYKSYSIKSVELGGMGTSYQSAPQMAAMAAPAPRAANVPLEPGREHVAVSMHGTIFLSSK